MPGTSQWYISALWACCGASLPNADSLCTRVQANCMLLSSFQAHRNIPAGGVTVQGFPGVHVLDHLTHRQDSRCFLHALQPRVVRSSVMCQGRCLTTFRASNTRAQ
jgi:hypothetical protein